MPNSYNKGTKYMPMTSARLPKLLGRGEENVPGTHGAWTPVDSSNGSQRGIKLCWLQLDGHVHISDEDISVVVE